MVECNQSGLFSDGFSRRGCHLGEGFSNGQCSDTENSDLQFFLLGVRCGWRDTCHLVKQVAWRRTVHFFFFLSFLRSSTSSCALAASTSRTAS